MVLACPSCGVEQAVDARFCSSCGAPLRRACPACGAEHGLAAAFCSACGTALAGGAAPSGTAEQRERRLVTVLFADLAGSTALAAALDPEDVRALQQELFEPIAAEVERFGGITEKFVGDAVLAVFGIPLAHEDDAERAVRAALALRDAFPGFATRVRERHGAEVGLRVGVNTGEVVSSREAAARGELIVSGDPVNVAARLQQHAQPGEVLVGERTRAVTRRSIVYGAVRSLDAKGKPEPVAAWPALRARDRPDARPAGGLAAPLIGRDTELALVGALAARAERDGIPQLVTVYGNPGVGKSRLLAEVREQLDAAHVLTGRCLAYGQGSVYWALAEAVKAHAGVLETDSAEQAVAKLRSEVAAVVPPEQAGRVLESIAVTVGLPLPAGAISPDPSEAVRLVYDAWARYLAALGREGLTVLAIEDLHWASGALLDLLDELLDAVTEARLLVVCTARPQLLEQRPAWGAGKHNATALTLAPLAEGDAARLVASLLGTSDVPAEVSRRVLSTAEGNPFFVEEILQMLIEQGVLERVNGGWEARRELNEVPLPDSVHGVVAARIDLLDAPAREVLRRCAVVGRVFWPDAVAADESVIASLVRRGLVSERLESAMAGRREFAFKHAVTRDVAYSTLTRVERRRLHRQVAEWIQGVAPDRSLETVELAAYHLTEAIEHGEDDAALVRRTCDLLLAAGTAALDRAALAPARQYLERALELATDDERRTAALLGLARGEIHAGDAHDLALELLDEVDGLLSPDDMSGRADSLAWRSRAYWLVGRSSDALVAANEAVETLRGLPESPQLARALARRSQIEMLRSVPEALVHAREAVEVARRLGDAPARVNSQITLFTVEAMRGVPPDPASVLAVVDGAIACYASDEAHRAAANFIWSAAGYLPVAEIEQTFLEARRRISDAGLPTHLEDYVRLSLAAILFVPSGRFEKADRVLAAYDGNRLRASSRLMWLWLAAVRALQRGDLDACRRLVAVLRPEALASGEPQRIIPMACAAVPWAVVAGETSAVRTWTREVLDAVAGRWSGVLTTLALVRALAAAGEVDLLAEVAASLRAATAGPSILDTSASTAEALLALAAGRAGDAVTGLRGAVEREAALGRTYHAACLELDLARALDAGGASGEAVGARARAAAVLEPLGCVHRF